MFGNCHLSSTYYLLSIIFIAHGTRLRQLITPYLGHVLAQLGQGITVQPQLGDDVLRHVGVDAVQAPRVALGRVQQLQKLLGVELETLEESGGAGDDQEQLFDQRSQVTRCFGRLFPSLE